MRVRDAKIDAICHASCRRFAASDRLRPRHAPSSPLDFPSSSRERTKKNSGAARVFYVEQEEKVLSAGYVLLNPPDPTISQLTRLKLSCESTRPSIKKKRKGK